MKNILHDLYYGRVSCTERPYIRTAEIKAVDNKIEDEKRYFSSKMSLNDCERFQELDNLYSLSNDYSQFNSFSYGFRLATMLMCAVFMDENE